VGAPATASAAEAGRCAPWTGEIEPLPSLADPDPLRAAWAGYRADQLAELARALEPRSRGLAHRLWRHARCLDPLRPDFAEAVARTSPVRSFRPRILRAREIELEPGQALPQPVSGQPWSLERPIRVVVARIPPPRADAAEQIAGAEKALREARFELAVAWVEQGRSLLGEQGPAAQRAKLGVLAATAEIALGREEAARQSLARALDAEPGLRLDPTRHSPKLVALLEEVRGGGEGARP
jgi:hypothetical protein